MFCVTGKERTVPELLRRLERYREEGDTLQEVRLDLLDPFDPAVFAHLSSPRILVTCRARQEGGAFGGSEEERCQVLRSALEAGPGYLDLEALLPLNIRQGFYDHRGATQIILSAHRFEPRAAATDPSWETVAAELAQDRGADILKVALAVEDAVELKALRALLEEEKRPVLRIGMGPAGLLSRVLYPKFGSPWTYVAAEEGQTLAPGQLSVAQARLWRVDHAAEFTPLGIIDDGTGKEPLGAPFYNRLLAQHRLPWICLPVLTARPLEALALLEALDFGGCWVRGKAQEVLAPAVEPFIEPAIKPGFVDAVLFDRPKGYRGYDCLRLAVVDLIDNKFVGGKPALVLGAGRVASSAAEALALHQYKVTSCNRSADKAKMLAYALGCSFIPWPRRSRQPFQLLVNATYLGSDGKSDPLTKVAFNKEHTVIDAAFAQGSFPPHATPLLQRAQTAGATVFGAEQLLFAQARFQLLILTNKAFLNFELKEALLE
jgi:3-dehydroquinate dehydratase/shikimate dehydrogenase